MEFSYWSGLQPRSWIGVHWPKTCQDVAKNGGSNRSSSRIDTLKEDWPQYVEQLEQFFIANDIQGEKK